MSQREWNYPWLWGTVMVYRGEIGVPRSESLEWCWSTGKIRSWRWTGGCSRWLDGPHTVEWTCRFRCECHSQSGEWPQSPWGQCGLAAGTWDHSCKSDSGFHPVEPAISGRQGRWFGRQWNGQPSFRPSWLHRFLSLMNRIKCQFDFQAKWKWSVKNLRAWFPPRFGVKDLHPRPRDPRCGRKSLGNTV